MATLTTELHWIDDQCVLTSDDGYVALYCPDSATAKLIAFNCIGALLGRHGVRVVGQSQANCVDGIGSHIFAVRMKIEFSERSDRQAFEAELTRKARDRGWTAELRQDFTHSKLVDEAIALFAREHRLAA